MATSAVTWTIATAVEDLSGLTLQSSVPIPEVGENEVLVELRAASLNYRDLVIAKGSDGFLPSPNCIPSSDGAGIVAKVGPKVQGLRTGDRVVTHMVPEEYATISSLDDNTLPTMAHICAGLGQGLNGTLTTHGVFHEKCLVKFNEDFMSFEQAATLSCSGITAWNAVMGLQGRQLKKGDWILVQGSGGVSVAAMQFALAVGATVVATTSSEEKGSRLRALGACHILNYRETPAWGAEAKKLTPEGRGFDMVIDVGGHATLEESLKSIRVDGIVVSVGMVAKSNKEPVPLLATLGSICIARGVLLGTRQMMRDMIEFIEENKIRPALDDVSFELADVRKAYQRLKEQKHFSKIVIEIPGKTEGQ